MKSKILLAFWMMLALFAFSCKSAPSSGNDAAEPGTHGPALLNPEGDTQPEAGWPGAEGLSAEEPAEELSEGMPEDDSPTDDTPPEIPAPRPPLLTLPPFMLRAEEPAPLSPAELLAPDLAEALTEMPAETQTVIAPDASAKDAVAEDASARDAVAKDAAPAVPEPVPQIALPSPQIEEPREEPREIPRVIPREIPGIPPEPPSFIRPAEPVIPAPPRPPEPVPPVPGTPDPGFFQPMPELPSRVPPSTEEEPIVFSRVVRATVGQVIEIPFRGTGWVYLGEMANRRGLAYESRRLDITSGGAGGNVEGQSFIFSAEAAGTYILKFYKQDFIQDYIINDYVQVIIGDASLDSGVGRFGYPLDRGKVVAEPRWPPSTEGGQDAVAGNAQAIETTPSGPPESEERPQGSAVPSPPSGVVARPRQAIPDEGIVQVAPPQAVPSPAEIGSSPSGSSSAGNTHSDSLPSDASPAEYVRRARQEFDSGRIEPALQILDAMKQRYPSGTDEAWWLYGQLLEASSGARDVRLALEYYRKLTREYPQSPRVPDAQRRIAYLERFYFNIR